MRVLLKECVSRPLCRLLEPHSCTTVQDLGLSGLPDSRLVTTTDHDVFITTDRNLAFQQNPKHLALGVLVLVSPSNRLPDLLPLVPEILKQIRLIRPGQVREVSQ